MNKLTDEDRVRLKKLLDRADLQNDANWKENRQGKYIRTPDELCEIIIEKIPLDKPIGDQTILVVDAFEFIPFLLAFGAKECNITFVAPYGYKLSKATGLIPTENVVQNSEKNYMPQMNKKFDVIVGNPPYSGELHLEFFNKCVDLTDGQVIFVHPSAWLVKPGPKSPIEERAISLVKKYESEFTFIKGFFYFGVAQYTPCTITFLDKTKERKSQDIQIFDESRNYTWKFNSIDDINIISDSAEYFTLVDWIKNLQGNKLPNIIGRDGNFFVEIPKIRGSAGSKNKKEEITHRDFYTAISHNPSIETVKPSGNFVGFQTEEEAKNFIGFLKTFFARFCLALLKFDQNIQKSKLKYIPVLDFTQPWTDDKIFNHFGIKKEWRDIILASIPAYYK